MPLAHLSNSVNVRNKQNEYEIILQNEQNKSPRKFTGIHSGNSPCKKYNNDQLVNHLRIKLSDMQFELKKLQQDHSVQMTIIMKQLQKERQQKKQIIKEWKQKLQEEIEYSNKKLQMAKESYEMKLSTKNQLIQQDLESKLERQKNQLQIRFNEEINKMSELLERTKSSYEQQINCLLSQHESTITMMSNQHSGILEKLKKQFTDQMECLKLTHCKQIQFYHQLQECKSKQNKAVQKIFGNKIKSLEQELREKIVKIKQLTEQLTQKGKQIDELRREKENYRLDNICWQRKYNKLEKDLQGRFDGQVEQIKLDYEQLFDAQKSKFKDELSSIHKLYQEATLKYEQEIKHSLERSENLLSIFNTSKSKEEDLKRIQALESKLIMKQLELEKQREDLKICRLQLNNMDQLFQKMFQQAKLKSTKSKKVRLPSLMAKNLVNKTTLDCYQQAMKNAEKNLQKTKQRKFSIREYSYLSMAKQMKEYKSEAQQIVERD